MSISENLQVVDGILQGCVEGKSLVADAITAKGVPTMPDASFDTLAVNVGLIEGGGGGNVIDTCRISIAINDGEWIPMTKSDNWNNAVENGKVGWNKLPVKNYAGAVMAGTSIASAPFVTFGQLAFPAIFNGNGSWPPGYRAFLLLATGPTSGGYLSGSFTKALSTTIQQGIYWDSSMLRTAFTNVAFTATEDKTISDIALYVPSSTGAAGCFQIGHFHLDDPIPVVNGASFKITYRVEF